MRTGLGKGCERPSRGSRLTRPNASRSLSQLVSGTWLEAGSCRHPNPPGESEHQVKEVDLAGRLWTGQIEKTTQDRRNGMKRDRIGALAQVHTFQAAPLEGAGRKNDSRYRLGHAFDEPTARGVRCRANHHLRPTCVTTTVVRRLYGRSSIAPLSTCERPAKSLILK